MQFTQSGFKYPDRIYGQKYQHRSSNKPLLLSESRSSFKQVRFSKFGVNLGPDRPVSPVGKFKRSKQNQSPVCKYRKEEREAGIVNLNQTQAQFRPQETRQSQPKVRPSTATTMSQYVKPQHQSSQVVFWRTTQQTQFDPLNQTRLNEECSFARYKPRAESNYGGTSRQQTTSQKIAYFSTNPWAAWNNFPAPVCQSGLLPSQDVFKESVTSAFHQAKGKQIIQPPQQQQHDRFNGKRMTVSFYVDSLVGPGSVQEQSGVELCDEGWQNELFQTQFKVIKLKMKGRVSAPGKVIVCGEHSAVYGHPVLAMAIDKRLECQFETTFQEELRITVSNVEITADSNETKLLEYLSSKITNPNKCHIHITIIKNEIIIGAGLGSSAAYAACLSASIVLSLSQNQIDDLIFDGTNYLEKLCHGKPSGCDAAVVITGGTIQYNLRPPPEFTSITPLTTNLKRLNMFVVYTGKPHDTKQLIESVSKFKEAQPTEFDSLILTIRDISQEVIALVQEDNLDKYAIWDYITMCQQYLQELGVSSHEIDDIVATCMDHEIHAKLTGAGGGGCVLCFPQHEVQPGLIELFRSRGYQVFNISQGHKLQYELI